MSRIKTIQEDLLEKQQGKCYCCGQQLGAMLLENLPGKQNRMIDPNNLVLVCPNCNNTSTLQLRESNLVRFLVSLLEKSDRYRNVNQESLIQPDLKYRADILAEEQVGDTWEKLFIEVKSLGTFSSKRIRDVIRQLQHYQTLLPKETRLVFAFPGKLTDQESKLFTDAHIALWDQEFIITHFSKEIESLDDPFAQLYFGAIPKAAETTEERFIRSIAAIPPGKAHWYQYQKLVGEILEFLFGHVLSAPITELPDKDEINRRDFILRNYCEDGFWKYVRERYLADFIVIDAKNYTNEVEKNQVLQIANYLKGHGAGLFAIIITRKGEAESAYMTRREQWTQHQKMIIVLDDQDLKRMILAKQTTASPEEVIKQKIEEFRLEM